MGGRDVCFRQGALVQRWGGVEVSGLLVGGTSDYDLEV
jgi:hypothetical protein